VSLDEDVAGIVAGDDAGTAAALAVSSLQAGIYVVLRALGVGAGSIIGCDALFPFGALAVMHANGQPRLPELGPAGLASAEAWRQAGMAESAAAVVTVLFGAEPVLPARSSGHPPVVIDAALSPFAAPRLLEVADVAGVSFAAGKPVSCEGGGLLLFRDRGLRDEVASWSLFGVRRGAAGDDPPAPFVPGLDLRLSPLLMPVLRRSLTALEAMRGHLDDSWARAARSLRGKGWRELPNEGSGGWYRAGFAARGTDCPRRLCALGIQWKRLRLDRVAASLVADADERVRRAAEEVAARLVWYRPDITGERGDLPEAGS